MFVWNVDGMARALKANDISERQKSHYLVALMVLIIFLITFYRILPPTCPTYERSFIDILGGLIYGFIAINGVLRVFYMNLAGDNKEFLDRFICLALPISVRIMAYFLLIALPVGIIRAFLPLKYIWGEQVLATSVDVAKFTLTGCLSASIGMLVVASLMIWLFWWISREVGYVSGAPKMINVQYIFIEFFNNSKKS